MSFLTTVPRTSDLEAATRAVTLVSPDARQVVYLDENASIEIITEALKAWGLRVRSERNDRTEAAPAQPAPIDGNWQTTRCESKSPGRLENVLSPLWLPIRRSEPANEPVAAWSWFSNAA